MGNILLFAVTLENFSFSWATVIMWVLLGEVRSWRPFNPRLMRGWVTHVMRVESVCRGGLRERALLSIMRLSWSIFCPCSTKSSLLE